MLGGNFQLGGMAGAGRSGITDFELCLRMAERYIATTLGLIPASDFQGLFKTGWGDTHFLRRYNTYLYNSGAVPPFHYWQLAPDQSSVALLSCSTYEVHFEMMQRTGFIRDFVSLFDKGVIPWLEL